MVAEKKHKGSGDEVEIIRKMRNGVLHLAIEGEDATLIRETLRECMGAETTVRAGGGKYEVMPDYGVRVAAARALAEFLGIMPKSGSVNLSLVDNSIRITLDQQLTEIQSLGVGSAELLGELREVVDRAEKALPGAKGYDVLEVE